MDEWIDVKISVQNLVQKGCIKTEVLNTKLIQMIKNIVTMQINIAMKVGEELTLNFCKASSCVRPCRDSPFSSRISSPANKKNNYRAIGGSFETCTSVILFLLTVFIY